MPDRLPIPHRWPPSRWDHVAAHIGLVVAALWWTVLGGMLLIPTVITGWTPSPILALLPQWVPAVTGGMLLVGGAATIWSVVTECEHLRTVWTVQQGALVLAASGWLLYAILLALYDVESLLIGGALTHAMIAVGSFAVSIRAEHDLRALIELTNGGDNQ